VQRWVQLAVLFAACHRGPPAAVLRSQLVRGADGEVKSEAWGQWQRRLRGDTPAMSKMALSLFTLAPGEAPHPPHRHAEEEIMILVAGQGSWHLQGQDSPAQAGDLMYLAPWDVHGLRNTGPAPLRYYVLKWSRPGGWPTR
jgi:mannose-6-phosphate isomerase-like protein (cupin superfamily)